MKRHLLLSAILMAGASVGMAQEKAKAPVSRLIENSFRNWSFEELPPAVQKTVRENYPGKKINDIDREDRTGQTVWEIEFAGGASDDIEIHVTNDGALLGDDGKPMAPKAKVAQTTVPSDVSDHKTDFVKGGKEQPKRVALKWEELPEPVKKAAEKFGGKDAVRDVDHEKREGLEVWELEFSRPGQNIELHFAADGRVLEHIDSKEARGSAPGSQTEKSK
jgi:uncharacterized membrane protein YkoI